MGGSITRCNPYISINKDPICAATNYNFNNIFPSYNILGGSGSFQPYNKLCGYNNYLPILLGADYLNTGGSYNMCTNSLPALRLNYCVPSTIGFLNQGNQTLFTIGGCDNDISSLLSGNNSLFSTGCGYDMSSLLLGSMLGGNCCGGLFGGYGGLFGGGGWLTNAFRFLLGDNGALSNGNSAVSWGNDGISTANGWNTGIFGSSGRVRTDSYGPFFSKSKDSNGNYAKSYLGGLITQTNNDGNKVNNYNGIINLALGALFA